MEPLDGNKQIQWNDSGDMRVQYDGSLTFCIFPLFLSLPEKTTGRMNISSIVNGKNEYFEYCEWKKLSPRELTLR